MWRQKVELRPSSAGCDLIDFSYSFYLVSSIVSQSPSLCCDTLLSFPPIHCSCGRESTECVIFGEKINFSNNLLQIHLQKSQYVGDWYLNEHPTNLLNWQVMLLLNLEFIFVESCFDHLCSNFNLMQEIYITQPDLHTLWNLCDQGPSF